MIGDFKRIAPLSAYLTTSLLLSFSILLGTCHAKRFTFTFDKHSMEDVAKQLSSHLNCKVVIDEELVDFSVSGHFMDITLQDLFSRIFREVNVVVLYDDNKRLISIHSFGMKSEVIERAGTGLTGVVTGALGASDAIVEVEPGVLFQKMEMDENGFKDKEVEPGVLFQKMGIDETGSKDKEVEPGVLFQEMKMYETGLEDKEVEPGVLFKEIEKYETGLEDKEVEPGVLFQNGK